MEVSFVWKYGGENVQFACSANDWDIVNMVHYTDVCTDTWYYTMVLDNGVYEYKFIVNGVWCYDMEKPTSNDQYGGKNNIVEVSDMYMIDNEYN